MPAVVSEHEHVWKDIDCIQRDRVDGKGHASPGWLLVKQECVCGQRRIKERFDNVDYYLRLRHQFPLS